MEYGFYLPNSGASVQPDALASIASLGDRLVGLCQAGRGALMPVRGNLPNYISVSMACPIPATGPSEEGGGPTQPEFLDTSEGDL